MKQLYLYTILFLGLLLLANPANAQVSTQQETVVKEVVPIEGLSIYPNPTSEQTVYVTTKGNKPKKIEIFNVLGKPVLSTNLTGNELSISSLDPGVYIMKIQEGNSSATRKLVVR